MSYHRFDGLDTIPNVEVFWAGRGELDESYACPEDISPDEPSPPGYYFWTCMPGCMPDSEADGPYDTEEDAIEAAREMHGDE